MKSNDNYLNKIMMSGKKITKTPLIKFLLVTFIAIVLFSSCNYLSVDKYFTDELKIDSVFASKRYLEAYMWEAASMFPNEVAIWRGNYTPGELATDQFFSLTQANDYEGFNFVTGQLTARSMGSIGTWYTTYYKIIRKCNTILNRMDEAQDLTSLDRFHIIGNTRFIRAYAYYLLLLDFGPPIILGDELTPSNEDLSFYDRPRSTYDEAVEYICSEFEEVSAWLPESLSLMEFGQPTKGAAYGLIAKLRLFHASPLFNGGPSARTAFATWKRSTDGVNYVSQSYDEKRWAIAAAAARRLIDMELYKLHVVESDMFTPELPSNITSDPDFYNDWEEGGAAGIDHFHSYTDMFNGESVIMTNPEYVWAQHVTSGNLRFNEFFPVTNGGRNIIGITQKVIDNYAMRDGQNIYESSEYYPYSETGFTSEAQNFSSYRLNSDVYNMYANREMRFYASIGFSECFWPMTSATQAGFYDQTITYYYDSPNGRTGDQSGRMVPATGYVLKKFIHPNDAISGTNARTFGKSYAMIRYADVLLWYAEALNNLTTAHTVELGGKTFNMDRNTDEIRAAFNQVRHRAGLPGITYDELADASRVQELIENERMIEFIGENKRYYDVRRWGIYEKVESEPITGMNIESPKDGFYRRVVPNTVAIGQRIVNKRLMFVPLPLTELRRLPSLDQNPGWED